MWEASTGLSVGARDILVVLESSSSRTPYRTSAHKAERLGLKPAMSRSPSTNQLSNSVANLGKSVKGILRKNDDFCELFLVGYFGFLF